MAVSISAISKDWGCARSYVQRCVKRGCPTDSLANSHLWRQANTQRYRFSSRRVEKVLEEGNLSQKCAQFGTNSSRSGGANDADIANFQPAHDQEESLEGSLSGIKTAVRESKRFLNEAVIEGRPQKVAAWISIHVKAVEAWVKAECMIREEMERQKILIPLAEAQLITGKVIGVIVSRLNALPQNLAARCDLTDPEMTMTALEEECAAILKAAQQAL